MCIPRKIVAFLPKLMPEHTKITGTQTRSLEGRERKIPQNLKRTLEVTK